MLELIDQKVYVRNEVNAAKMKMSAQEVDLFCLLATKVKGNDFQQITVTYKEFEELYGESRVYYKFLSPIFDGLMHNIIEVYDKDAQKYVKCVLITKVEFSKQSGFAVFYLDIFVANLLQYVRAHSTIFQLRTVLLLRSVHAKRIYMMASQFKKSKQWTISVEDLKDRLGMIDKKKGTELYKKFSNFQSRVLDQAVKEINEHAEFRISIVPGVQGKERTHITFIIYSKSSSDVTSLGTVAVQQVARMRAAQMTEFIIQNVLFCLSEKAINKTLYSYDINKSKITNSGAWLAAAFESQGVEIRKKLIDMRQLDLVEELKTSAA